MHCKHNNKLAYLFLGVSVLVATTAAAKDKAPVNMSKNWQVADTGVINSVLIAATETAPLTEEIVIAEVVAEIKTNNSKINRVSAKELLIKELHPLSISYVQAYQQKNEAKLMRIEQKFARQFSIIDQILDSYSLPTDLKYLAIIESELNNRAVSHKGAVGPWQFMAPTGRLMGLTINQRRDDRRDLVKSTHAAAKYLKILHNQFNDWLLVIAAYNGGASRVEYAIKKSNSRDFWRLQHHLPAESRLHVKKYIATKYVFDYKASELADPILDISKLTEAELENMATLRITGKYKAAVIAQMLEINLEEFNRYNPGFDSEVIVNGYDLRLTKDKMELFQAHRSDILGASIQNMLSHTGSIISGDVGRQFPEAIQINKPKAVKPSEQRKKLAIPTPEKL